MPTDCGGGGGNGKSKPNLQLGIQQFPPIPKACLPPGTDTVPPEKRCDESPIIDHYQNRIENPVCPPEFFHRALSGTALSFNGDLQTTVFQVTFPKFFNRVIIINDNDDPAAGSANAIVSASIGQAPNSTPLPNANFSNPTGPEAYWNNHMIYTGESRTFEIWGNTLALVADAINTGVRVTVFFP